MTDILKIPSKVLIRKFHVEFSYLTKRNNKRMRTIEIKSTDRQEVEFHLNQWIEEYNSNNPHKAYSNAKILECVEVDREIIEIK